MFIFIFALSYLCLQWIQRFRLLRTAHWVLIKKNSKNNKEQQQQQIESPLRTLHKMAAGKSNSLAPTQAAAGNGNGVRFGVEGGERGWRGEKCTQFYTVPQLMLCPSNINNKHNSRRGNNNSNKSVTTAGTPRQGKEEKREGGRKDRQRQRQSQLGGNKSTSTNDNWHELAACLGVAERKADRVREQGRWRDRERELFVCTLRNLFYCCLANKFHKFPAGSQTPLNFGRHLKESCRLAFWIITRTQRQAGRQGGRECRGSLSLA